MRHNLFVLNQPDTPDNIIRVYFDETLYAIYSIGSLLSLTWLAVYLGTGPVEWLSTECLITLISAGYFTNSVVQSKIYGLAWIRKRLRK